MKNGIDPKLEIGSAKWRQYMSIPKQVVWEIGIAMLEGSLKYGFYNYRKIEVKSSTYLDAALGHIDQYLEGEDIDPDSGISHITKAIASLIILRDCMMNGNAVDDRPPKIKDINKTRKELQKTLDYLIRKHNDKKH